MLFQGSKHVGSDRHFAVLKDIGASEINGTTNPDRTNYFETVPSHPARDRAVARERSHGPPARALLTQASLDNQIEVVRNERRQRYDNVAYGKAPVRPARGRCTPEGHPYRYLTIGRHEDLASASLDDVIALLAHLVRAGQRDP
jgi:zinc protease